MSEIGSRIELKTDYENAVAVTTAALKEEGFGVLTTIDVQATFKQKLDAEFRRYVILGACNPPLAYRALTTDFDAGLLLPCNVIVYEKSGGSIVSIVDPLSMLGVIANPWLEAVARDAREKLKRVAQMLREEQ
ncbi:MAG: DUF302 domain-containing protein [Anaerolineae bacterium]|nr:DUF302 domain-containing protein [Anaerolineae bacterium]